jgi:hypothetical protein
MKLLDKQLEYSLHGDFEKGWEVCQELERKVLESKTELCIDTQKAYIRFKQLEEKTHNYIRADFNRGWYEMMNGNLLEGFILMNTGRNAGLWGNKHIGTDKPMWDGEDNLRGKSILFVCEAGLGDQILFVRFVKEIAARGGKIVVACEDYGLGSMFSRIPQVSAVVNYQNTLSVYHDYWIPSMAAPQVLKTEYEDLCYYFPGYLSAKDEYVKKFSSLIQSDKLKVGIRWLSMPREGVCNTLGDAYLSRKFPAGLMFEATMQDHVQLYSLQRDEGVEDLPRMSGIVDLGPLLKSWEDTAGAIENLDLVISSCTSIAHLAAAMGKPTWIVVPLMAYYTWALPGKKTPWYDSVRLFRQREYGKWNATFKELKEALRGYTS